MFNDLPTPTGKGYQYLRCGRCEHVAHYRLGKKRPGSGNLVLYSRSALMLQTTAVMPKMTSPMTAVLAFQLAGCAYHPPAGDQTCLGYLSTKVSGRPGMVLFPSSTYGIFPPLACSMAAPFDWTVLMEWSGSVILECGPSVSGKGESVDST